ncbi:hypothetical protein Lalb_Chr24g0400071 [Lupinus albus]|uniref:Uncharacterized protein n=1 Tax=Lupinus albus TaxID=3870 RepID=A0A6A4N0K7_LUPAL|nr:hypothetical protein Lalb_Chr24g0400071 [Lupinus albus]
MLKIKGGKETLFPFSFQEFAHCSGLEVARNVGTRLVHDEDAWRVMVRCGGRESGNGALSIFFNSMVGNEFSIRFFRKKKETTQCHSKAWNKESISLDADR